MAIFIEVIEGPHQGQKYLLDEGMSLGRAKADLLIPDSKVSSNHAYVSYDKLKDQYLLIDNDSSNGIIVNQQKVKKVALLHGVNFQLGRTKFRVQHIPDLKVQEEDVAQHMRWTAVLRFLLPQLNITIDNKKEKPALFSNLVKLEFTQGIQVGESIPLAYGPRAFGSGTMNHRILEKNCPEIAFYLIPEQGALFFKTLHPDQVLLNNSEIEEAPLKGGETITIDNTVIKVHIT